MERGIRSQVTKYNLSLSSNSTKCSRPRLALWLRQTSCAPSFESIPTGKTQKPQRCASGLCVLCGERFGHSRGYVFQTYLTPSTPIRRFFSPCSKASRRLTSNPSLSRQHKTKPTHTRWFCVLGGERGIRTLGTLRHSGFQDQCDRPLCHLSIFSEQTNFVRAGIFWLEY